MMRSEADADFPDTAVPIVVEGEHRARLKDDLLHAMQAPTIQAAQPMKAPTRTWKRAAWAAGLVLAIITVGAAATEITRKCFIVENATFNDGGTVVYRRVGMSSADPAMTQEKADQQWKEMQELMAQGNAELVKVVETAPGRNCYVYRMTLASGEQVCYGDSEPLRDSDRTAEVKSGLPPGFFVVYEDTHTDGVIQSVVASAPDQETAERQWKKELQDLLARGKGNLMTVTEENGKKLYTYSFSLPDGKRPSYRLEWPLREEDAAK